MTDHRPARRQARGGVDKGAGSAMVRVGLRVSARALLGIVSAVRSAWRWCQEPIVPLRPIDESHDRCVSCQSRDLKMLASRVYRCNACGFEGGEGRAAWARAQREASFLEMEPAKRMEGARQDLLEARSLVRSGFGDLRAARTTIDEVVFDQNQDAQTLALVAGTGRILEARNKLRDASAKLGLSLPAQGIALPYRASIGPSSLIPNEEERQELRALLHDFITDDAYHRAPLEGEGKAMFRAINRTLKLIS